MSLLRNVGSNKRKPYYTSPKTITSTNGVTLIPMEIYQETLECSFLAFANTNIYQNMPISPREAFGTISVNEFDNIINSENMNINKLKEFLNKRGVITNEQENKLFEKVAKLPFSSNHFFKIAPSFFNYIQNEYKDKEYNCNFIDMFVNVLLKKSRVNSVIARLRPKNIKFFSNWCKHPDDENIKIERIKNIKKILSKVNTSRRDKNNQNDTLSENLEIFYNEINSIPLVAIPEYSKNLYILFNNGNRNSNGAQVINNNNIDVLNNF